MNMPTLDELREKIKDRKLSVIADAAGVTRQTVYNFSCGATKTLELETYQKLVKHLFPTEGEK